MIKYCLDKLEENESRLEQFFRNSTSLTEYSYEDLVMFITIYIFDDGETNPDRLDYECWDYTRITEIDNGEYQGTLLYMIPRAVYQPAEYDYLLTYIDYGSCSVCDTLESIQILEDKEEMISELMTLCRDIITHIIVPYNHGWRYKKEYEQIEWKEF